MKDIFKLMLVLLCSLNASAYEICKKENKACLGYTEENKAGGYDLYFNNQLIKSFDWYASTKWDLLKKIDKYYLANTVYGKTDESVITIYELDKVCSECVTKVVALRDFSLKRVPINDATNDNIDHPLQGMEKKIQPAIPIDEIGDIPMQMKHYKVKKIIRNPNVFYISIIKSTEGSPTERTLYSPPTTKDEINALLIGCINNCEFKDDAFQQKGQNYTFFGDISGKIAIKIELKKEDSNVTGQYCYLKNCKEFILLNGSIDNLGNISIDESVNKKITGKMELKPEGKNSFKGEWISPEGKKFSLFMAREE